MGLTDYDGFQVREEMDQKGWMISYDSFFDEIYF